MREGMREGMGVCKSACVWVCHTMRKMGVHTNITECVRDVCVYVWGGGGGGGQCWSHVMCIDSQ